MCLPTKAIFSCKPSYSTLTFHQIDNRHFSLIGRYKGKRNQSFVWTHLCLSATTMQIQCAIYLFQVLVKSNGLPNYVLLVLNLMRVVGFDNVGVQLSTRTSNIIPLSNAPQSFWQCYWLFALSCLTWCHLFHLSQNCSSELL